jgi:hypothetical protein
MKFDKKNLSEFSEFCQKKIRTLSEICQNFLIEFCPTLTTGCLYPPVLFGQGLSRLSRLVV